MAELQNQLVKAEMEQAMLSAKIEAYKRAAANETVISDAIIDNKVEMYPEILQVKREIVSLQLELQSLDSRSKRGENGRTDAQISQQIQKYQQFLELLRHDLQKRVRTELQSVAAAKRDEQIAAWQTELETQRITAEMLRDRYVIPMNEVKQTSGDTLQLQFKQAELDRAEKVYAMIAERIVELRTETARRSALPSYNRPLRRVLRSKPFLTALYVWQRSRVSACRSLAC